MCLVAFAFKAHPCYRLIVAANRDEFHGRPAEALHWWPDRPDLVAGRDLQAGGTWLAVSRSGRFATVTNYREDLSTRRGDRSRGELVTGFIAGAESPLDYCGNLELNAYAGFSLLTALSDGKSDEMAYVSNRGDHARRLPPGIYGLSNASLDTPWDKVLRSKAAMESLLATETVGPEALFRLLADRDPAPTGDDVGAGLSPEIARAVSAPFIAADGYGTRCSTVLLIEHTGRVEIHERRFDNLGNAAGESRDEFQIG